MQASLQSGQGFPRSNGVYSSVRAPPPWTTCSPIGAVVDQQVLESNVFDKVAGMLSTVPMLWRLHVKSKKIRGREAT